MIKNIIFDIGNVLVYYRPMEYLNQRYSVEEAEFLLSAIFKSAEWLKMDRGVLTEEEALERFIDRNPEKQLLLKEVMGDIYSIFTPIEKNIDMLKQLKQKGYTIWYLSNISHTIFAYIDQTYDFLKECKGGIASAEVNVLKPHDTIYLHFVERFGIKPEESLFIDDTEHNVNTAEKLGFSVIHLAKPDSLHKNLAKAGIHLS